MPLPNEHSARVKEPIPSNAAVTRRKQIASGISIVLQKNKGDSGDAMQTQSYRFSKTKFTPDQARSWLKSHKIGFISFEPATDIQQETKKEDRKEMIERIAKEIGKEIA